MAHSDVVTGSSEMSACFAFSPSSSCPFLSKHSLCLLYPPPASPDVFSSACCSCCCHFAVQRHIQTHAESGSKSGCLISNFKVQVQRERASRCVIHWLACLLHWLPHTCPACLSVFVLVCLTADASLENIPISVLCIACSSD